MNNPVTVSNAQARKLFLSLQGLSASPREKQSTDGLLAVIRSLGFVQVDSINTVARAHHMILFSRNQTYRPHHLTYLLEKDRSLFEHWTHDASVIPAEFYPYWQHRFVRDERMLRGRWRKSRREGFEELLSDLLKHVSQQGPVMTRDFKSPTKKGTGWWDWNPEKTALEYHWRTGSLAISGRKGFQKIYDLSEKVIPDVHRNKTVSEAQFIEWACQSAMARLGLATSGEIAAFWGLLTAKEASAWVEKKRADGELEDVLVEAAGEKTLTKAVARAETLAGLENIVEPPKRIRLLSPFDPLIRDRKRCLRLFGFDYRIEVFVPEAQRKYGYYVFPLLEGQNLIGRIDMKCDKGVLYVTGLWFEPGVKLGKNRKAALHAELERYRRFVDAMELKFDPACHRMMND